MPVPRGITAEHVRVAIERLGPNETIRPFSQPTRFWLHDGERRYAPKAVLGLARQIAQGGPLLDDFAGGDGPSGANTILASPRVSRRGLPRPVRPPPVWPWAGSRGT